jgi:hypothetical protein
VIFNVELSSHFYFTKVVLIYFFSNFHKKMLDKWDNMIFVKGVLWGLVSVPHAGTRAPTKLDYSYNIYDIVIKPSVSRGWGNGEGAGESSF